MNLLCSGDWHIRETSPKKRKDNIKEKLLEKFLYMLGISKQHNAQAILQPGDWSDAVEHVSYLTLGYWINFFLSNEFPLIYTILGQHDTKNHSISNNNIPANVIQSAGVSRILSKKPTTVGTPKGEPKVKLYGCHFGQVIPRVKKEEDVVKILLVHKMIIKSKVLWNDQTDYSVARKLLKKHNYNLIVSGDNHERFIEQFNGKTLVNMGSLIRTNIRQVNHKPAAVIYNTVTQEFREEEIPVEKDVFDTECDEEIQETKEDLLELVRQFKKGFKQSSLFVNTLKEMIDTADTGVKKLFNEIAAED